MSKERIRKKSSNIWAFFTILNTEFASCNLCKRKFSYRSTTNNLRKHVLARHPTVTLRSTSNLYKEKQMMREDPEKISDTVENYEEITQEAVNSVLEMDTNNLEFDTNINMQDYVIIESSSDINATNTKKCVKVEDTQVTPETSIQQSNTTLLLQSSLPASERFKIYKRSRQDTKFTNVRNKSEVNPVAEELKIQRFKHIMAEETEIAEIKLQREKNLLYHEQTIQNLTVQHMKRMHELEYREAKAKTLLIELQLEKETRNNSG